MQVNARVSAICAAKRPEIYSLPPDAAVYSAIELMAEKGIGALLVVEHGKLIGIMSERDYARKVILMGRSSKDTPISEIMTSPPISIPRDTFIDEAMRIMSSHRIRHLPVVDGDRLTGLVSMGDLVHWIISTQQQTIGHLQSYIASA